MLVTSFGQEMLLVLRGLPDFAYRLRRFTGLTIGCWGYSLRAFSNSFCAFSLFDEFWPGAGWFQSVCHSESDPGFMSEIKYAAQVNAGKFRLSVHSPSQKNCNERWCNLDADLTLPRFLSARSLLADSDSLVLEDVVRCADFHVVIPVPSLWLPSFNLIVLTVFFSGSWKNVFCANQPRIGLGMRSSRVWTRVQFLASFPMKFKCICQHHCHK